MSDIRLFSLSPNVQELIPSQVLLEKELQTLIEKNMETLFGVRFLKSEYAITNGRMDSIGIDENNCPVIFEYKRNINENVINQGLFYLDWLLDHKANFHLLVADILDSKIANSIDWTMPHVICIANSFTKYDLHAVNQMQRNIELVQYHKYGNGLLLFEHLNIPINRITPVSKIEAAKTSKPGKPGKPSRPWVCDSYHAHMEDAPASIREVFDALCSYIEELGPDIIKTPLKFHLAYKKVRNLFCIEVFDRHIRMHLQLNPDTIELEEGFSRDMRGIHHAGTGDVRITLRTLNDVEKAKPFLKKTYDMA